MSQRIPIPNGRSEAQQKVADLIWNTASHWFDGAPTTRTGERLTIMLRRFANEVIAIEQARRIDGGDHDE